MANYLQATTATGVTIIDSTDLPEGADILYPHDFMEDLRTLKDGEVIFTYVYPEEMEWIDAEFGIQR
jgi:hypothetical protein